MCPTEPLANAHHSHRPTTHHHSCERRPLPQNIHRRMSNVCTSTVVCSLLAAPKTLSPYHRSTYAHQTHSTHIRCEQFSQAVRLCTPYIYTIVAYTYSVYMFGTFPSPSRIHTRTPTPSYDPSILQHPSAVVASAAVADSGAPSPSRLHRCRCRSRRSRRPSSSSPSSTSTPS